MINNLGRGFTIVEFVFTFAVIAILGMISIFAYQNFTERSRATDIVVKYDAIRSGVGAEIAQGTISNCADVAQQLGTANLVDEYAQLGYGFEAVSGGYRPVLTVCAKIDRNGPLGVKVARGAHDTLAKTLRMEKGAVLTDTLVSFAVALSDSDKPVCTVPMVSPTTACGDPAPVQAQGAASGHACPPGQEWASHSSQPGVTVSGCVTACKPGQIRDPNNWRWCAPAPTPTSAPAQTAASITCAPGYDKVLIPGSMTSTGIAAELCLTTCPAGQTRSTANPLNCVAAASATGSSGLTGAAGAVGSAGQSAVQGSTGGSSSSITPAQRVQQCKDNCRASYPHGNSNAYRSCLAACN